MDANNPLSPRANAFSIASLMSDPDMQYSLLDYGYHPASAAAAAAAAATSDSQSAKDCYYDCSGMVAGGLGQWGASISRGIKGMEGGCGLAYSGHLISRNIHRPKPC